MAFRLVIDTLKTELEGLIRKPYFGKYEMIDFLYPLSVSESYERLAFASRAGEGRKGLKREGKWKSLRFGVLESW